MKLFLFYIKRFLLVEGVILGIALVICLLDGKISRDEYGTVLLIFGAIIFSIGPLSLAGSWNTTRNFGYQYVRLLENNSREHRLAQDKQEIKRSQSLFFPSMLFGTVTLLLSALIPTLLA